MLININLWIGPQNKLHDLQDKIIKFVNMKAMPIIPTINEINLRNILCFPVQKSTSKRKRKKDELNKVDNPE